MKKILASIFLIGFLVASPCVAKSDKSPSKTSDKTTIDAWISDEKCGANIDADCSKQCQKSGAKLVVVNITDKSIIPVSNQDTIREFVGQHVTVTGTMKEGALTVVSVKPIKKPDNK